jgi:hypothetical protein
VSSEAKLLGQTIGRTVSPQCSADFGDEQCGVVPEEISATVLAVTDDLEFTVGFTGGLTRTVTSTIGKVEFTSGGLAGTRPIQIFLWTAAGDVTLLVPAPEAPAIGDELTIKRGCSKIRKSDDPTVPTCKSYNNVDRMRAFPDCVGSDQALALSRFPGTAMSEPATASPRSRASGSERRSYGDRLKSIAAAIAKAWSPASRARLGRPEAERLRRLSRRTARTARSRSTCSRRAFARLFDRVPPGSPLEPETCSCSSIMGAHSISRS